jgi:hypothetical protein
MGRNKFSYLGLRSDRKSRARPFPANRSVVSSGWVGRIAFLPGLVLHDAGIILKLTPGGVEGIMDCDRQILMDLTL